VPFSQYAAVLFKEYILNAITAGHVHLAFRRWEKPRVKPGSRVLTSQGIVEITDVAEVADITEQDAIAAGSPDRASLWRELNSGRPGAIYRITVRHAGDDPRVALRARNDITSSDHASLQNTLRRLDSRSSQGPWTQTVLEAINSHPHQPAAHLATLLGYEKEWLKLNTRKLKNLGLTISHQPGYELSPRGRAFLTASRG